MELQVILGTSPIVLFTAFLSMLFFTAGFLKYLTLAYKIPVEIAQSYVGQLGFFSRVNIQAMTGVRFDRTRRIDIISDVVMSLIGFCIPSLMWLSVLVNKEFWLFILLTLEIGCAFGWSYSIIRAYWLICKHNKPKKEG